MWWWGGGVRATNEKCKETSNFVIQKRNIRVKRRTDYDCCVCARVFVMYMYLLTEVFLKNSIKFKIKIQFI